MFTESYNVRAGKDLGDHPVLLPCFTDAGTEIKGNEGPCPSHTTISELLRLEPRSLDSRFMFPFLCLP